MLYLQIRGRIDRVVPRSLPRQQPERGINRVLNSVIARNALDATPSDFLKAIKQGMESQEELSAIIPGAHSEASTRSYLFRLWTEIGDRITASFTAPEPTLQSIDQSIDQT